MPGDAADLLDLVRQEQGHARRASALSPQADGCSTSTPARSTLRLPLADVLAEAFPWCSEHREELAALFRAYGARKRALGVIDLDDLLLYWRRWRPTT